MLQLVRSNSRRFMPSQADEEAHQLSYLQKHMPNILSLLAEPVEGESEGEESLVCKVILASLSDSVPSPTPPTLFFLTFWLHVASLF